MTPVASITLADDVALDVQQSTMALLAKADIRTDRCDTQRTAGLAVLVFNAVDEALLAALADLGRTASVLGISVGSTLLSSRTLWSLMHAGADDILQWPSIPASADDVKCRLDRWAAVVALMRSDRVRDSLVGTGAAWRSVVRDVVEAAAFTTAPVLITGESGTGKELIARLIHDLDPRRRDGDLVIVDCTTMSAELAGSELFGHDRGAFTGANMARDGAFALADKGTLFLDEIGELSPQLQAQLLRVVQEQRFKRVGSNHWQSTDVRLVSATNRDLVQCVAQGTFRADLYYRINGWQCRTLPLRDHKEDVLPLARHFIAQLLPHQGEVRLEEAVREFLVTRDYAGNVRELRQLVTRICHRHAGSGPITIGDIPPEDRQTAETPAVLWPDEGFRSAMRTAIELGIGMKEISQMATDLAIDFALEREDGNLQRAATRLHVTDRALQIRRAHQRSANQRDSGC